MNVSILISMIKKVEYSCKAKFRLCADFSFEVTALFVL